MRRTRDAALVLVALLSAGCGYETAAGEAAAGHRATYLLGAEPPDAQGVLDVREALMANGTSSAGEVVLVGRIGGVAEPFTEGRGVFVIVDPATAAEGDEHGHECGPDCPYCAKQQDEGESLAFIQFLAPDGEVLEIDARKLFPVEAGQTVVVRGAAAVDEAGYMIVSASGLYIRR
jgi:hypothetical protein